MTLGNVAVVAGLAASLVLPGTAGRAEPAAAPHGSGHAVSSRFLLGGLSVGPTYHSGYVRTKFELWTSHPDGCDTRSKVLIRDAVVAPRVGSECALTGGKWRSPYDGAVTRDSSRVQVDHMVPLAAAWGAGAWRWTPATRRAFANDLGTRYDLLAVSASANESKSDRSPDQWLPPRQSFDCRYMADYTAVLWRWRLHVSASQQSFLAHRLRRCGWPRVFAPTRPSIGKHPTGGGGGGRHGQVATGIKIGSIAFDPPGDDTDSRASLDAEWVKVVNTTTKSASLNGWALHDSAGHRFAFHGVTLAGHRSVKVHTGPGRDTGSNLYWGSTEYIWNNTGDTASLVTSAGNQADRCSYTAAAAGGRASC